MDARVKATTPYATITACSGMTFTKHTWTSVPASFAREVEGNPFLEIFQEPAQEAEPELIEAVPTPTRRRKK